MLLEKSNRIESVRILWICLVFVSLTIGSCKNEVPETKKPLDKKKYEEAFVKANKYLVKTEDEQIADFLSRYHWNMKETGSGLRYLIYHHGNGLQAKVGMTAKIKYETRLITGDLIYTSDSLGYKEFVIGKADVESGLQEGILLMHVGDEAKMILPSHLAFGLAGDHNRIPPYATLVYDVELLSLKK